MSKIIFTTTLFLVLPFLTWAQEEVVAEQVLQIGEQQINYGEMVKTKTGALYYDKSTDEAGALMIASSHDTNADGKVDVWFVYDANQNATLEAYDQDGDGDFDKKDYK